MSVNRVVRMTVAVVAAVVLVGWGVSFACDHGKETAKANGKAAAEPASATVVSAEAKATAPCAGKDMAAHAEGKPCPFSTAAADGKPCAHAAKGDQAKDAAPCPHAAKTAAVVAQSEKAPEPAPEPESN